MTEMNKLTPLCKRLLFEISKDRDLCLLQIFKRSGLLICTGYKNRNILLQECFITMEFKRGAKSRLIPRITKRGQQYLKNDKN